MFEAGKEYLTRDGQKARIYAVDGGGEYPIRGAYWDEAENRCVFDDWRGDGSYHCGQSALDLMLPQKELWLNVYPDGSPDICRTKEQAEAWGDIEMRIARVKVNYHEGQFDD